jgi:O-antigen/teichoic acid export membrane protein
MFASLLAKAKNNPDYAVALASGYAVIAAQIVAQVLLVPLYIDALGSYRFGVLMILLAQAAFAYLFIGLFFSNLLRLFREAAQPLGSREFSRIYCAGKISFLGVGLLFAIVVLGLESLSPVFFEEAPAELRQEIFWASVAISIHFIMLCEMSVEQTVFAASGRQTAVNLVTFCSLFVFTLTAAIWLWSGGGLVGVGCCFLVGDMAARILAFVILRRTGLKIDFMAGLEGLMRTCRALLSTRSQHYYFYALLAMLLQSDILLLGWMGGPALTAEFALIWKIAEVVILLVARVGMHLQPEFVAMDVEGDGERLVRVYSHAYWGMLGLSLAAALGYGLFGQAITRLWVGADQAPTDPWLYWLAAATIFWLAAARLPAILAQALSQLRGLIVVSGIELVGKLVLLATLLPIVGVRAPLIAMSAMHVFGVAFAYGWLGWRLAAQAGKAASARIQP